MSELAVDATSGPENDEVLSGPLSRCPPLHWQDESGPVAALGPDHLVQFYEDEEFLFDTVARFLCEGARADDWLLVIATRDHQYAFRERLESLGTDVNALLEAGRLTLLDASETLALFMRDGAPDPALFECTLGQRIASTLASGPGGARLRAYGEMVDVLWRDGQEQAAIQLEELWNALQGRHSFALLCAYAMGPFYTAPSGLQHVCRAHTHVMTQPSGDEHLSPGDREATAPVSQVTRRLTNEIVHRQQLERALRDSLGKLRSSEEQLVDFVENATVGLHRVNADGIILWANRAELELLGYAEDEYVGKPIACFHSDLEAITDILGRLSRGERLQDYEARLRAKDGSIKHVQISSSVYSRNGKFVHTRCFTRDVTEHRQAEQAVRQQEGLLRTVADALPVFVSFVDADQRCRFVSAGYERLFGRSKTEAVGKRLEEVLGPAAYVVLQSHVARALEGSPVSFEAEIPETGGGTRWLEGSYLPQRTPDDRSWGFVAVIADITERKAFERIRAQAATRTERLLKITAAIADAVSAEEVFVAVVDHVAGALDASTAALWLLDEEARTLRLARSQGYHEAAIEKFEAVALDTTPSFPALDCVRRGEPIWIGSQAMLLAQYPHLAEVATAGRSYRVACLPLVVRGRVLGALGVTIERAAEAVDEEREFLYLAASYASQAVERLRLLATERRLRKEASAAAERLGLLSQVSRTFADPALDLESRLRAVAMEMAAALGSVISISLLESDGLLHLIAIQHPDPEGQRLLLSSAPRSPLKWGEGVSGAIAATGQSVILPSIDSGLMAARAAPAYRSFLERFPVRALIGVPLKVRGRVIGTLTAGRVRQGETYTTEDLRLLEELAERAASAVESARLYQDTVQARATAERLYRFAHSAVAAEHVEVVYSAALASIEGALGTPRAAILTFDSDGVMRFRAWHGLSDEYRSAVEGHSPWSPEVIGPQPVLVPDAAADVALAPYAALLRKERIAALAFIPLVARGRLLGKFMAYYEQPRALVPQELETARAIANHLASVIARFAAVAKLEETIHYNELFAGVLAHDLRNPLNAILTAGQLLARSHGASSAAGPEARVGRILSSGQRMAAMIDQLLDFTRARSGGQIELSPQPADLANLLQQAVAELALSHPDWRIRCDVVGNPRGTWDSDRLLQVLSNLVGNAGQHGRQNSIITAKLDGSESSRVLLEVHNGGAIPQSLMPQLFEPFRTTQPGRGRSHGLGLGLFIVREIVRAHGGRVDVESTEAAGTTFRIDLPRHTAPRSVGADNSSGLAQPPGAQHVPPARAARAARGARTGSVTRSGILIVDDDVDVREALQEILEGRGYRVSSTANGAEALQLLRSTTTPPSVILLDLMMPVMDGYEFLDVRRSDPALAEVPVVVITAGHRVDHARLGDDTPLITKPIKLPQLMSTLQRFGADGNPS